MSDMMCDALSELLQSAHDTVEGVAFSPDSGVSSCSDSEPSSPTLLTPCSVSRLPAMDESVQHFTQLANADFSSYADSERMSPDMDWLSYTTTSVFPSGDDWGQQQQHAAQLASSADVDWSLPCSTSVTEQTAVCSTSGDWIPTKAGFHICHTGPGGNAKVKLASGLTYDIDIDITDFPQTIAATVVKQEFKTENTTSDYEDSSNNNYPSIDMNNIISMTSTTFAYPQDDGCSNCLHNRNFTYGHSLGHCPKYHDVHPHPHPHADANDHPSHPSRTGRRTVTRTERLWEFILRLLGEPKHNPRLIEWVDRDDGTFRLNNSKAIAHMWGMRKNNVQMTYEKLSRALRYYYHRQILEPVLGKKLVYRFGPNAVQVWEHRTYRPQAAR